MNPEAPHILLVNPWIHDFAAYDVWAKPLGLLTLGAILREHGCRVSYIDCLDRFHPKADRSDPKARCGRGPYRKTPIAKPVGMEDVPRTFSRYGIKTSWFRDGLRSLPPPDLVFVTSIMTYWWPGVRETIDVIRSEYPAVPVILGGIYATLCTPHAIRFSGADEVVSGPGEKAILQIVERRTGFRATPGFIPEDLNTYPCPAFDLQRRIGYIPIQTSRGCPFSCDYCASSKLNPIRMNRSPDSVVEEIRHWYSRFHVRDFTFYDDALLIDSRHYAEPLLQKVIESGMKVRFHTPNALHIREITPSIARLMKCAGFHTIRLGLETAVFDQGSRRDRKVTETEFQRSARSLRTAGFNAGQIGAYLLVGLPGQSYASVAESIRIVKDAGIRPIPAYYTPIPHTPLWSEAVKSSRYDLEADPVYTNNAIFPCQKEPFSWEFISNLKQLIDSP